MTQPCYYCLARANAVVLAVTPADRCAAFMREVSAELRRRDLAAQAPQATRPRRH